MQPEELDRRLAEIEANLAQTVIELRAAENAHAELWAERNGWQARAEIAEAAVIANARRLDWLSRVGPIQTGLRVAYMDSPSWVHVGSHARFETMCAAIDNAMGIKEPFTEERHG